MSGAGETQLEIERRIISDKEAKIRRELLTETASRKQLRQRRKASHNAVPTVALVFFSLKLFVFNVKKDWLYKCWKICFDE